MYEEAIGVLSFAGDESGAVRVRGKAALSAITLGELEKASGLLQATMEAITDQSPQAVVARTYYQISQLHWHSARHGDALEAAEKALEASLSSEDVSEKSHAYKALALACHSLGDWQKGIEYELLRDQLGASGFDTDEAFDAHL